MASRVIVPERISSIDVGAAYRGIRDRLAQLTAPLTVDEWERVVPHCPAWTVRETLAHLSGVVDDALNNNMTGVASEAWTAAHVRKRAEWSGPAIVEEWVTYGPFVDARASEVGLDLAQLLFDAVTHEHDLRHALGAPGARDSDGLWVAAHFATRIVTTRLDAEGLPPITLIVAGERLTDVHAVELHGSVFDVVRAVGSRRSVRQISDMDWTGDPSPYVDRIFPFTAPQVDIVE